MKQTTLQGETRAPKASSGMSDKLKVVDIWKHFIQHPKTPTEDFILVGCIHCDKKIPQRKYSTSRVRSHLFYNHPDQYKKVVTQELAKKKEGLC